MVSSSWKRASLLFERCVKSICNQTSNNYKVVVVCHEIPIIEFSHQNINYVQVDFAPPKSKTLNEKLLDKQRKALAGLLYAKQLDPSHIMQVDADDCVSRHLAAFVERYHQGNGWFINQGYEYEDGSQFIYFNRSSFHLKCGSSNIIKYSAYQVSETQEKSDEQVYTLGHRNIEKSMRRRNMPIEALPFPGAIYNICNGENIYYQKNLDDPDNPRKVHNSDGFWLRQAKRTYKRLASQLLTNSIRDEFGLYPLHD